MLDKPPPLFQIDHFPLLKTTLLSNPDLPEVPRYANDVIHLMGLEGFSGSWDELGQLLQQVNNM